MILIVSYGNPLRGDDGAGIMLGEIVASSCRKRNLPVERLVCQQLMPELVLDLTRPAVDLVIFTDTRVAAPGSSGLEIELEPVSPTDPETTLGHHLCPEFLVFLADRLYERPISAWQITVPGIGFSHGTLLSRTSRRALDNAPALLESLLDRIEAELTTEARRAPSQP